MAAGYEIEAVDLGSDLGSAGVRGETEDVKLGVGGYERPPHPHILGGIKVSKHMQANHETQSVLAG